VNFDIERARRDTPATSRVAHLNNAGAALPPMQVTEAVIAHVRLEADLGGYEAAASAAEQGAYSARAAGCGPLAGSAGHRRPCPTRGCDIEQSLIITITRHNS